MGFRNHGLRAIAIATLVAIASISVHTAPVAATDPSPSPAAAPTASLAPTATPATSAPAPATAAPATAAPAASTPVVVQSVTTAPVTKTVVKPSVGARVAKVAMAQRGKRYARGSMGPMAFDCSGLVRYSYRIAGVLRHIGGGHSARGMYRWARLHGLTSRSNPQIGDIAIYGNGTHAAIYVGHGRVVSALNRRLGIRVTSLHALTVPFTTFIHTHI